MPSLIFRSRKIELCQFLKILARSDRFACDENSESRKRSLFWLYAGFLMTHLALC